MEDWYYKKAEENAHNEILAFFMVILGMNLLIGGLLISIVMLGEPVILPFVVGVTMSQSESLGLILTVAGFSLISAGFLLIIHYDRKRSWFLREIEKTTRLKVRTINETKILEELLQEK